MESARLYLGCLMMMAFVYCVLSSNCNSLDDVDNLVAEMNACYTQRGFPAPSLQVKSGSVSPMAGLTDRLGADACSSKRSDVIDAVRCSLQANQDCHGSFGSVLLPSPDVAGDMINLECQQSSTDLACIAGSATNNDVLSCIMQESRKLASKLSSMDTTQMLCASLDTSHKCMQPAIEICGPAAVSYMAEFSTGPFRPKACGGGTAILPHPVMLFFSLFAIMLKFYMA